MWELIGFIDFKETHLWLILCHLKWSDFKPGKYKCATFLMTLNTILQLSKWWSHNGIIFLSWYVTLAMNSFLFYFHFRGEMPIKYATASLKAKFYLHLLVLRQKRKMSTGADKKLPGKQPVCACVWSTLKGAVLFANKWRARNSFLCIDYWSGLLVTVRWKWDLGFWRIYSK